MIFRFGRFIEKLAPASTYIRNYCPLNIRSIRIFTVLAVFNNFELRKDLLVFVSNCNAR